MSDDGDRFGYTEADVAALELLDPATGKWISADEFRRKYPAIEEASEPDVDNTSRKRPVHIYVHR